MSYTLSHESLGAKLTGVELPSVLQFRGVPRGRTPARFAKPVSVEDLPLELDCTKFGWVIDLSFASSTRPRCPQVPVDVGHLLRLPASHTMPHEPEDEFACLNLDVLVSKPKNTSPLSAQRLSVFVWIHGGSQAMTFGNFASGVCDMTILASDAQSNGTPIVCVSIQYRVNIFCFGDEASAKNLAVLDQALAIEWVQQHIMDFGGDPLAKSAGAVCCHVHMINEAPAKQIIPSSGTLNTIMSELQGLGQYRLRSDPCHVLLKAINQTGIKSSKVGNPAKRLLLRDAVIWREGIWSTDPETIAKAFNQAGPEGDELKLVYKIDKARLLSCILGALDFINDYRFVLPIERLVQEWRAAQRLVYHCLVNELNPWQPSNGAHHAVDLSFLSGGLDHLIDGVTKHTGKEMRRRWIVFIHRKYPWRSESYVAFGPHGTFKELSQDECNSRRRLAQIGYLAKADSVQLDKAFGALAARRISLLN
ncbi:Alpha/Beta hydrolase protein [Ilyonectria robusta]|uniref:Alpha/Beta hydrolase protein n=1 Tax=Ilyonectria robusta TaxID=1079257 RepID=UPI001E8E8314|nr:Alpha/Beta hydrolase protein [Ilyonectria robusta]KAH8646422.1 Alpha/Beta hydrolase protein [Ilyonectria robusta]